MPTKLVFLLLLYVFNGLVVHASIHEGHAHEGHDHGEEPHEVHKHAEEASSPNISSEKAAIHSVIDKLNTTAALDLVSDVYTSVQSERAFDVNVRSAELIFESSIDRFFDGTISFAGHTVANQFLFELHEGYVSSSTVIPSSRFKVGKFLLGVGLLNQKHQHDWNFTSSPKVHREFFADEAASDTGVEYSYLPTENVEIKMGATSGYCYGHCHGGGNKAPRPLYYIHPSLSFELSENSKGRLGLNYLTRRDHQQIETHLTGVDFEWSQFNESSVQWLNQTEIYYQEQAGGSSSSLKQVGAYTLTQYGINDSWFLGLRFDAFSELSKKFQTTGERRKDFDYAIVPLLTWKPSESATLRFSYTFDVDTTQGDSDDYSHLAQLQFNFVMGAHSEHGHNH